MKFGLFYLSAIWPYPAGPALPGDLEEIAYGEELGFDSVGCPSTTLLCMACWQSADLGGRHCPAHPTHADCYAGTVLPFHHTLRLAEDAALVDVLSQGRLLLGGDGAIRPPEFHGFGVRSRPRARCSWRALRFCGAPYVANRLSMTANSAHP